MSEIQFQGWPKIARLNRDIVITEKIDGTEAAVGVVPLADILPARINPDNPAMPENVIGTANTSNGRVAVYAQSRNRIITPQQDNYGFAKWVEANFSYLAETLGPGVHHGEWWGSGIQRGYGLPKGEKRFSLFNASHWDADEDTYKFSHYDVPGLYVVPVLYQGPFTNWNDAYEDDAWAPWRQALWELADHSFASPGFTDPEGIVIYHTASRTMFKVTIRGDESPKGQHA